MQLLLTRACNVILIVEVTKQLVTVCSSKVANCLKMYIVFQYNLIKHCYDIILCSSVVLSSVPVSVRLISIRLGQRRRYFMSNGDLMLWLVVTSHYDHQ